VGNLRPTAAKDSQIPSFGHATRVYNVIDVRQSYLQDVVVAGLRALGFDQQAGSRSIFPTKWWRYHALLRRARHSVVRRRPKRPYVEVSGRKGLGVKADDLMDKLIEKALEEVASRHAEASTEEQRMVAQQIAIGALRYFLLNSRALP